MILLAAALVTGAVRLASVANLVPSNFWLLQEAGIVSADEDKLVASYIASLNAGDSEAAEESLAALTSRPIAVDFEDPAARVHVPTTLPDGTVAEELAYTGPRNLLLPGAALTRINELDYGDGGLGSRVWDAAIAMQIWLCSRPERVHGQRVLELGAGVGAAGIAAALAGASAVTLTEVAAADGGAGDDPAELGGTALLETLEANCALNGVADCSHVVALDWSDCLARDFAPSETYPLVLAADCVHREKYSLRAFSAAVAAHTAAGGVALLMCTRGRPGVAELPEALREAAREGGGGEPTIEVEEMALLNSFGVCELVLVSYRPE